GALWPRDLRGDPEVPAWPGAARGMEAEAGVRAQPPPPGSAGARKSREQQEPEAASSPSLAESPAPGDRPPNTSGVTDPTRHTSHRGEAMLERPAPGDVPPKSNRVTEPPRQTWHWGEEMLERPAPGDVPPKSNRVTEPPRHWREEMLESPAPQDRPPKNTGVSTPPRPPSHWGAGMQATPALGAHSPDGSGLGEPLPCPSQPRHAAHKEPGPQDSVGPPQAGEPALLAMLTAVASSPLPVRSQQKDEPDLTAAEKLAILRALYRDKPVVFLERFRRALRVEHLGCFAHLAARYEVRFYCEEVRRAARGKAGHTRVRNKRYAALQQLIKGSMAALGGAWELDLPWRAPEASLPGAPALCLAGGEYFSDEQMRAREPLLYEQYVGQYLSDEELLALGSRALAGPCPLSGVLLRSYQEQVLQLRLHIQQEQEDACMEEEEDDEGEESSCASDAWVPDAEEKAFLREEFTSRMHQRFLDGKDGDFDYSEVDENPEFDNLDIVSRDEEERYFDGEEEEEEMEAE
ncbi:coiled-coil domain containing 97, partial [Chelydra serpentina]